MKSSRFDSISEHNIGLSKLLSIENTEKMVSSVINKYDPEVKTIEERIPKIPIPIWELLKGTVIGASSGKGYAYIQVEKDGVRYEVHFKSPTLVTDIQIANKKDKTAGEEE